MRLPAETIAAVRDSSPLVHCMTNIVVANFQANGLLALGASPIMADSAEEASDIAALASCTLLNIGTLDPQKIEAMLIAGKSARAAGNPLILDPVGAGATPYRKRTAERLLQELDITMIRGNAGEIAALANIEWKSKGVDAGSGDTDITEAARRAAKAHNCLVAVTGDDDIITDGVRTIRISGGHPMMTATTGTGCLLSAICGAFLAVGRSEPLLTAAYSLAFYKKCGEAAAEASGGPGDFPVHFLNALHSLDDPCVRADQFRFEEEMIS
ncbi:MULTISPECIES: hydroxyethylthiazole kinase [Sporosarcina]|uniref:hydroxyethylthiazole kinase n=1 Tax=Sporosarcina TaxID=1569 RepID=UPI00058D69D7|nr:MULTISPECIES: hydroxyethylthiazole kinase [Sporosarcina]WJY26958.1 hydroxyethylthiazole kinase [Sporosarcina sp. 0.2-SM1T-5]